MTDCRKEFPAIWFARAKLSPSGRDCSLNFLVLTLANRCPSWRQGMGPTDDPRG
jgi:hypothetical protein